MEISINKNSIINVQGKKEYLYGLNKAAKEVHSYSMNMQPRLQRLGENHNAPIHLASAKAYLDILTNDFCFWNHAYYFNNKDLKYAKELLAPIEQVGVKPLEDFSKILKEVMNQNSSKSNPTREHIAQRLLDKLA